VSADELQAKLARIREAWAAYDACIVEARAIGARLPGVIEDEP
jgi:hypothetical protein